MYTQAAVKPGEHVCSLCGLVNGEVFWGRALVFTNAFNAHHAERCINGK